MKVILLRGLLGITLVLACIVAQAQSALRPEMPHLGPRLLTPGMSLPRVADSVYLVSAGRLRFYQQLHRYAADTTADACAALVRSYRRNLRNTQRAYERLFQQYHTADSLSAHTLHRTRIALGQTHRSLDYTRLALAHTTQQLAQAEQQLQVAQRQSFFRRFAYGAGGMGLGALLVLLVR